MISKLEKLNEQFAEWEKIRKFILLPKEFSQQKDELTPTPKSKITPTPSTAPERPYVEILDTPTGWLRVRKEPNTQAAEITKVNPKETYKFSEANETGWYKIELPDGQEGWISGQYAKLYR